jgi:hypothetical protein
MANSSIDLVGLDFNSIKSSFISYLKSQDLFKDYDFEGSNMSVLMDLMAYNTYKNSFYLNMAVSESFLDSAQLTASVLSHSKELNYTPRSNRSSKAKIKVTFEASGETQPYVISKGSSFTGIVKGDSHTFTIPETIVVSSANTTFTYETDIYEGIYLKDSYIVDHGLENQRFIITNKNVDTTSLTVVVYEDGAQFGETYVIASTLLDLSSSSKVFFLQASDLGNYEIIFGDGIIGRKPKNNSTVVLDYRISNGARSNGIGSFSINFEPTSGEVLTTPEINVIENSMGGAERESIDSIKYYAPRHFQIQERAITPSDYEIILKTQFPEINAISVYGGEEVSPPRFGKVFISIDVSDVDGIPENKKDEYYNYIKRKSPLSIDPIIIEPMYTYLSINSIIRYNLNITKSSPSRLKTLITQTITDYNTNYLDDFNVTMRYSKLLNLIDISDSSIVSNITEVEIYKKINPQLNISQNIDVYFNTKFVDDLPTLDLNHAGTDRHTIRSTKFVYNGLRSFFEDDGDGNLRIMQEDKTMHKKIADAGYVDYANGIVYLRNFNISDYDGSEIRIYAKTKDKDISVSKNTILTIEPDEITINIDAVRV